MSAERLLQFLTQVLFVIVFLSVAIKAWRTPNRANIDIAMLFGLLSGVIGLQWVMAGLDIAPNPTEAAVSGTLLMALPYMLLRLVADFSTLRPATLRLAGIGLLFSVVTLFWIEEKQRPTWLLLYYVIYFVGFEILAAVAFVRESRRSSGVTARRMEAVAAGSILLGLVIFLVPFGIFVPALKVVWSVMGQLLGLASGMAYFVGFAPPPLLRRAWQEPELRAFLMRASSLTRLPDKESIIRELQQGVRTVIGASGATIGLWDESARLLRFHGLDGQHSEWTARAGETLPGRAFILQHLIISDNAERDDAANGRMYRQLNATALLAAPITSGAQHLGVLAAYSAKAPIFAEDDLSLLALMADQAAIILESRTLIEDASQLRAREEATRLKDDFLSAAAHDFKSPLTALITQIEVLERRAIRKPDAPPDLAAIQRMLASVRRLNSLVTELLDAARLEQGMHTGGQEPLDLSALVLECCGTAASTRHPLIVDVQDKVTGRYNPTRMKQLLSNLLSNAVKYSPDGGEVKVKLWKERCQAHLSVADSGIGIPSNELTTVFERFHRGSNVDDRRFAGMGLGLFICRGIVEEHGGRIWVNSAPGQGSVFEIEFPIQEPEVTT